MDVIWVIFLFVLGACVGSFLNVVIYRMPRGESIVFPGSHCPSCGNPIGWHDNLPIVSWLALRGRCRKCRCRISPRYLVIEAMTGLLVAGLYLCYYVLRIRDMGRFEETWPYFASQAVLLCGLVAASAVDVELYIVPLPVMWVCAAVGIIVAVAWPEGRILPPASPRWALAALAATMGLLISELLLRLGVIQPSFIDAQDKPLALVHGEGEKGRPGRDQPARTQAARPATSAKAKSVAITKDDGVDPRLEVLRELLFLLPAIILGVAAWLVYDVPAVGQTVGAILSGKAALGRHLLSGAGALLGLLAGVGWIWGIRILGTLGFGKEAMGMGDVHILAAIGAVNGPAAATLTFFLAPVFGLIYALHLLILRGKRELPYGPWLAVGALASMLFYDPILEFIRGGLRY